jgi:outer membrane beta-barrel protein
VLPVLLLAVGLSGCSLFHHKSDEPVLPGEEPPGTVIEPDVARRQVKVPKIRSQDFEIGAYTGILSVQDLQSALTYGVRAAYHVSEDFFLEADYGRGTVSDEVRRVIGQPFFPSEYEPLSTYSLTVGYNLLPGEVFLGTRHAMTSTFYVLAGAGNTSFNNEDFLTYNAGFGLKVLPLDWLSVRVEARDRAFTSDLLGTRHFTNNLETTVGLAAYF